jgi:hypothetical protein
MAAGGSTPTSEAEDLGSYTEAWDETGPHAAAHFRVRNSLCRVGVVFQHSGFSPEDHIFMQEEVCGNRIRSNGEN